MAAVSIVLTPWSKAARIAPTASRSSVPPHIHPPIAQAPKMIGETKTSDVPSLRGCMEDSYRSGDKEAIAIRNATRCVADSLVYRAKGCLRIRQTRVQLD